MRFPGDEDEEGGDGEYGEGRGIEAEEVVEPEADLVAAVGEGGYFAAGSAEVHARFLGLGGKDGGEARREPEKGGDDGDAGDHRADDVAAEYENRKRKNGDEVGKVADRENAVPGKDEGKGKRDGHQDEAGCDNRRIGQEEACIHRDGEPGERRELLFNQGFERVGYCAHSLADEFSAFGEQEHHRSDVDRGFEEFADAEARKRGKERADQKTNDHGLAQQGVLFSRMAGRIPVERTDEGDAVEQGVQRGSPGKEADDRKRAYGDTVQTGFAPDVGSRPFGHFDCKHRNYNYRDKT